MLEALLADNGVNQRWEPTVRVALVNGRHWFSESSQLASGDERYNFQSEGLRMCMIIRKVRQLMTACKIVIYGHSCIALSVHVFSVSNLLNLLKVMLTCAKTYKQEYCFPLTEAKTVGFAADLEGSNFTHEQH